MFFVGRAIQHNVMEEITNERGAMRVAARQANLKFVSV